MNAQPNIMLDRADGGIAIMTLNRHEIRNAISDSEMIEGLLDHLALLNGDASVRVLILTGAGTAFSSGGNVSKMSGEDGVVSPFPPVTRMRYRTGIQRLPLAFEALDIPVIAAVNGPAVGAGCDLACMCDIRIAAESANFAESFVKLGLIPGDGGAWLLPRVVGFAKASEMALTGDRIDAREALACGLVSQVVADDALMETALNIARRIAVNPPHAVRMTRRLLREAQKAPLETILELSAAMQALAHATEDHKEALAAFSERRQGQFTGR